MNSEQIDRYLDIMERQAVALETLVKSARHNYPLVQRTAIAVEQIATALGTHFKVNMTPNYEFDLGEYQNFDWSRINAKIIAIQDECATIVQWNGKNYKRRSPDNKFGAVIYFSRHIGKDANGDNCYEQLIAFKPADKLKVEPIGYAAQAYINSNPQK